MTTLGAMAAPDEKDAYSRSFSLAAPGACPPHLRLGVPRASQRQFFGDQRAAKAYDAALARFVEMGATLVEIDVEPFHETARLLYEGPWVAERYLTARELIEKDPGGAASGHAADRRRRRKTVGGGRLQGLLSRAGAEARLRARAWPRRCAGGADGAGDLHRRRGSGRSGDAEQPARHLHQLRQPARPVRPCGARIARARTACRSASRCLPPAGRDMQLASIGAAFHARSGLKLGASDAPVPPLASRCTCVAAGRDRHRRGRRASFRHAAERRIARARTRGCSMSRRRQPTTSCSRCAARCRQSRGCCAWNAARAAASRWRSGR